jgi:hypothetical protein
LEETSVEFYLGFSYGILNKRKQIRNKSEIIQLGIKSFREALKVETQVSIDEEEHWISRNLRMLLQSFGNFVIVDQYEIMLELIKGELKTLKKNIPINGTKKDEQIKWLLSKFLIALDIHFYLKNGSIKLACESIF